MTTLSSNRWKYELLNGTINGCADVFKIILMSPGFSFNRVTHGEYTDLSANELSTGSGYTVGGNILAGQTVSQDDILNKGRLDFDNTSWTATGGSITASAAVIYNDTHVDDIIVGYIDFNGDQTTLAGGVFTIADILITVSDE